VSFCGNPGSFSLGRPAVRGASLFAIARRPDGGCKSQGQGPAERHVGGRQGFGTGHMSATIGSDGVARAGGVGNGLVRVANIAWETSALPSEREVTSRKGFGCLVVCSTAVEIPNGLAVSTQLHALSATMGVSRRRNALLPDPRFAKRHEEAVGNGDNLAAVDPFEALQPKWRDGPDQATHITRKPRRLGSAHTKEQANCDRYSGTRTSRVNQLC
jgi:hypothetical protein